MLALARLLVIGFVVLTVIYVSLSLYSRAVRRAKLESRWHDEGREGEMEEFVREGLKDYDQSLRRKLILGVYIVPTGLILLILYLTNFT
ncbi:hypothetical protein KUH32_07305 [Thalassococcus sp. CAU 1522]|uniref:Cation/multidrug efflux pump n=1 Tax=Thalassococcus arenae TaxID=2851652 RepID=A0ABS6N6C6_9RHOB|nr:hypothetical protein [Thalassococcus arenae]MBV2359575.1 hypothetical protein [Thalassococcus arenae]